MKNIIYPAVSAALISLVAFTLITTNWKVNVDESVVKFSSKRVNGTFKGLKAAIAFDKEHPEESKISASIDASTLATGFFLKNSHAKDALDVDKYPIIKFVSASVSKNTDGYLAKGSLTMKAVTRPAIIYFTFEYKGTGGVFKENFKVIPKDFGIDRNGTPDEVIIDLIIPVTKS